MKKRLPVSIENRVLPDDDKKNKDNNLYGYVNILFLASVIATIISIMMIIILIK